MAEPAEVGLLGLVAVERDKQGTVYGLAKLKRSKLFLHLGAGTNSPFVKMKVRGIVS